MMALSGLVVVSLLCLCLWVLNGRRQFKRSTNRRLDQIAPHFRPVDIEQLKEMLNIAQEGYLRLNLTAHQFHREQTDRISLAIEYFGRMSHNVVLLYKWGCSTLLRNSRTSNLECRKASRQLIDLCREFRSVAWLARIRLRLWLLKMRFMPFAPTPYLADVRAIRKVDLIYTYEQIKMAAFILCEFYGSAAEDQVSTGL